MFRANILPNDQDILGKQTIHEIKSCRELIASWVAFKCFSDSLLSEHMKFSFKERDFLLNHRNMFSL
jgi:hypothetical protein